MERLTLHLCTAILSQLQWELSSASPTCWQRTGSSTTCLEWCFPFKELRTFPLEASKSELCCLWDFLVCFLYFLTALWAVWTLPLRYLLGIWHRCHGYRGEGIPGSHQAPLPQECGTTNNYPTLSPFHRCSLGGVGWEAWVFHGGIRRYCHPWFVVLSCHLLSHHSFVTTGIYVAMMLRFDHFRNAVNTKYFPLVFGGYVAGLVATVIVMHTFNAAQVNHHL